MSRVRLIDGPAKGQDVDLQCRLGDLFMYTVPDKTRYFGYRYENYIIFSFIGQILLAKLANMSPHAI